MSVCINDYGSDLHIGSKVQNKTMFEKFYSIATLKKTTILQIMLYVVENIICVTISTLLDCYCELFSLLIFRDLVVNISLHLQRKPCDGC